jgi:hypothetical protein
MVNPDIANIDVDELANVEASNPPEWMTKPRMLERASEISAKLLEEGYSEEQAYEIALERLQGDENLEDDMHTIDEGEA